MKGKRLITLLLICSMLLQTGCTSKTEEYTDDKLIVAVTIVPEQTFVEAVCQGLAQVITLIPAGYSPESYEPSPELMEKFNNASLYFAIGVAAEKATILSKVGENTTVISLQDDVSYVYEDRTFESGERDPHIWLSPKRAIVMVQSIVREMSKIDPDNEAAYQANGAAYIAKLTALDETLQETFNSIDNKSFIVYHPAFGYLAEDYGLTMYALEEEGKEATVSHLQDMIDFAKKENIKAVFYQEEIDSSQSEAFAEEIGGITIQLSPLAADYINNLETMANTMAEAMK